MIKNQQHFELRAIGAVPDMRKESVAIHEIVQELRIQFNNFKAANFEMRVDASTVTPRF